MLYQFLLNFVDTFGFLNVFKYLNTFKNPNESTKFNKN